MAHIRKNGPYRLEREEREYRRAKGTPRQPGWLSILSLWLGLALLALNLAGRFIPLRSPYLGELAARQGRDASSLLSAQELLRDAMRRSGEGLPDYLERLTHLIHRQIVPFEHPVDVDRYHLRVPPWENYLLYAATFVMPFKGAYAFCDHRKALERGVGLCDQQAMIVDGLLEEQGIKSKIMSLRGHVLSVALVDPKRDLWWVLDPTRDVVVKLDYRRVLRHPSLAAPFYQAKYGDEIGAGQAAKFGYAKARVFDRTGDYLPRRCCFEAISYYLVWIVPLGLVAPWLLMRIRSKPGP